MKVRKLLYNWFVSSSDDGSGEDYSWAEVGFTFRGSGGNKVVSIAEHFPQFGLYKWHFDILLEDGTLIRTFNPNTVEYYPEEKNNETN